ncbi:hypothetical protein Shyhy01_32100 [Streptomyces hygroscopicus subsp. hygroscopicus]|uniref:hypothetical protein n=1 Tax=Streptomyces sp. KHY 26 TaxID=3097359 RepID=UPI0024A1DE15|nr:hypothetical protein [Streptomyces hygroscopicus]GLX50260.1 hypothetical protein Shyhy01_32100 [Streptomyces hygroscopicus subsp. hygroscopicus]
MGYKSEAEIKQALGIDSWRNLSKDKMIRFAAMMPDMGTEAALKIIEQFPSFKEFATDVVNALEKSFDSAVSANKQSQEHFHQALQHIREILQGQLEREEYQSWEERKYILDLIMETGRLESLKDSENKRFLSVALKTLAAGGVGALVLGVAFIGGKVMAESKDSPEDSLDA